MKFILAALLLLVIIVTPVLGKNEDKSSNSQGQGNNNQSGNQNSQSDNGNSNSNPGQEKKEEKTEEKAQASTSPNSKKLNTALSNASSSGKETCDPNYPWKNHGEYVSCVAKSGAGGQAVSEAARSDIGKKNQTGTPSASLSPSPDATSSASPSAIISPSPEGTSSGLISSITNSLESVKETVNTIANQFAALLELLNPFN